MYSQYTTPSGIQYSVADAGNPAFAPNNGKRGPAIPIFHIRDNGARPYLGSQGPDTSTDMARMKTAEQEVWQHYLTTPSYQQINGGKGTSGMMPNSSWELGGSYGSAIPSNPLPGLSTSNKKSTIAKKMGTVNSNLS